MIQSVVALLSLLLLLGWGWWNYDFEVNVGFLWCVYLPCPVVWCQLFYGLCQWVPCSSCNGTQMRAVILFYCNPEWCLDFGTNNFAGLCYVDGPLPSSCWVNVTDAGYSNFKTPTPRPWKWDLNPAPALREDYKICRRICTGSHGSGKVKCRSFLRYKYIPFGWRKLVLIVTVWLLQRTMGSLHRSLGRSQMLGMLITTCLK